MSKDFPRAVFKSEDIAVTCKCGKVHLCAGVFHYDRVIMECSNTYFAIRPQRFGPLKLIPWPGPNLTREEMGGQKSADQIVRAMNQRAC